MPVDDSVILNALASNTHLHFATRLSQFVPDEWIAGRAYEDFVEGRITDESWRRKSEEWEADLRAAETEIARLHRPRRLASVTTARIIELAKNAEILDKSQVPVEQRRLLETVLSNCLFERGTLCPSYTSSFDLLVRGNELEIGGERGIRAESNERSELLEA
jgi:hypothetical protein